MPTAIYMKIKFSVYEVLEHIVFALSVWLLVANISIWQSWNIDLDL